jgi:CBS domain-containing protein
MSKSTILTQDAALATLESRGEAAYLQRPMQVGAIMTADVATCTADDTLNRCAQIMWERACGCVPVIDDFGRAISMITDRDICMAAYIQGKPLSEIVVSSAMSKRLIAVQPCDGVSSAEAVMRRSGVRRLLVVDKDAQLVGVLSIDDIMRHAHLGPTEMSQPLSERAIAQTATALSHGRAARG